MKKDVIDDIEAFTCLMHSKPRKTSINTSVRSVMLKKLVGVDAQLSSKSGVDLARLPPARDNLIPHIWRVNHSLATYKRADQIIFEFPKPHEDEQGSEKTSGGSLVPLWLCGPILPPSLVDLIPDTARELEDTDDDNRWRLMIMMIRLL